MTNVNYKVNSINGELSEYAFELNGILALRNFTARVDNERLIIHSAQNINFCVLDALVSEVEINGVIYDNPLEAQRALQNLVFNSNTPIVANGQVWEAFKNNMRKEIEEAKGNVRNVDDKITEANRVLKDEVLKVVESKITKEDGKGLSTNDFTDDLKRKLETLSNHTHNISEITGAENMSTVDLVRQKVGEIQIGGRNLVLNSGKLVLDLSKPSREYHLFELKITPMQVFAGEEYMCSFDIQTFEGKTASLWFLSGREGHIIISDDRDFNPEKLNARKKVSFKIRILKNGTINSISIYNHSYMSSMDLRDNNLFVISNIKIERGNKPTDWTPAPEDTYNQLETTMLKINRNITTSRLINNLPQNGRMIITQGTENILVTIDSEDGFTATYQKVGTGNVTFQAIRGKNLIPIGYDSTILNGKIGSTATVTVVGDDVLLRVMNI